MSLYINNYQNMNPIVNLKKSLINADLWRLDVEIENAPEDLFGVAFHLKFDSAEWNLGKYEAGNVFNIKDAEPILLASSKSENDELIFGISLKKGDEVVISDGILTSFYLNINGDEEVTIDFTDNYMTVFDKQRVDLEDVEWNGLEINLGEADTNEYSLYSSDIGQANILNNDPSSSPMDSTIMVYSLMLISLIAILVIVVSVFLVRKSSWYKKQ